MKKSVSDEVVHKGKDHLRGELSPEQYNVLVDKGTEAPFSGKLLLNKESGMYVCPVCDNELFSSNTKFDSGTGWPSFSGSASKGAVVLKEDRKLFMNRTEVVCGKCSAHLGHVFDDGPSPSGKRFCINSAALNFKGKSTDEDVK